MKTDDFKFTWVSGDGGPLILMEQKYLTTWEGSDEPSNGRVIEANSQWVLDVITDYDRACSIEDYLGLINVGEGKAIVLGGDEMATTWFPLSENSEGILIR
ncbi:MAG: Imm21 family immunity protein, partial [Pyrinomonadaceae bacterium]